MTAATRNRCTLPNPARNWLLTPCSFQIFHQLVVSLFKPNRSWVNFLEELMIAGFGLATLCCSALGGRSFWGGRFLHMHQQQQLVFFSFFFTFCISSLGADTPNWKVRVCVPPTKKSTTTKTKHFLFLVFLSRHIVSYWRVSPRNRHNILFPAPLASSYCGTLPHVTLCRRRGSSTTWTTPTTPPGGSTGFCDPFYLHPWVFFVINFLSFA